jgi:PPM family protein phosphatase
VSRPVRVAAAARTHRGAVREMNQDVVVVGGWASAADEADTAPAAFALEGAWAAAVVDGMGGHAHGELAAWMTAHALIRGAAGIEDAAAADALVQRAHALVSDAGAGLGSGDMGAACAALIVRPQGWAVLNVGDCRVYRVVRARLDLLTVDDVAPRRGDPRSTVLTQSIGGGAPQRLDAHWFASVWVPGDTERFVLASDGLLAVAEPNAVVLPASPVEAARALVDAALAAGAPDNVSVVIVDVVVAADDPA